jgi:uncharacterized protein
MSAPSKNDSPAALVIRIKVRQGAGAEFSSWHAKATTAAAGLSGFISAEVNAPTPLGPPEWNIIQHFRTVAELGAWCATERHRLLLGEAKLLVDQGDAQALHEEQVAGESANGVVTEVVTTYVKPGKDGEYQRWAEKIHRAESQFPGYRGGFLQSPASDQQRYWTTLVRFANAQQLDVWLNSEVRRELLREHNELVQSWEHHRLPSSFAGWFPTDPASGSSPPSWKQSMLVVLMLFPIVALEVRFLTPILGGLNAAMATFIGNVISVFLLAWPFMPIIVAAMNWWVFPREDNRRWIDPAGIALLIALYAIEIAVFSRLL